MSTITGLASVVAGVAETARISFIFSTGTVVIRNTTLIAHNKPRMRIIASSDSKPKIIHHNIVSSVIRNVVSVQVVVLSGIQAELPVMSSADIH